MMRCQPGYSLWPDRAHGRKRLFSRQTSFHVGLGVLVFLIAAHSAADLVAWQPLAVADASAPTTGDPCRRDRPTAEAGCSAGSAAVMPRPVIRPFRVITDDRDTRTIPANALETSPPVDPPASTPVALDRLQQADRASLAPATISPPVEPVGMSEQDLTFKHGNAWRRAALARSASHASAAATVAQQNKLAQAKRQPRGDQMAAQVYELADGHKVVVHRRYGNAQADARMGEGGFRSAEIGSNSFSQRFGEPAGARPSWFSPGGVNGLY